MKSSLERLRESQEQRKRDLERLKKRKKEPSSSYNKTFSQVMRETKELQCRFYGNNGSSSQSFDPYYPYGGGSGGGGYGRTYEVPHYYSSDYYKGPPQIITDNSNGIIIREAEEVHEIRNPSKTHTMVAIFEEDGEPLTVHMVPPGGAIPMSGPVLWHRWNLSFKKNPDD